MEDEDLSCRTTGCETQHIPANGGVCGDEGEGVREFAAAGSGEADPGAEGRAGEVRREHKVGHCEGGGHDILSAHHLRSREALESAENLVLDGVREAIEEQVDAEEEKTNSFRRLDARSSL